MQRVRISNDNVAEQSSLREPRLAPCGLGVLPFVEASRYDGRATSKPAVKRGDRWSIRNKSRVDNCVLKSIDEVLADVDRLVAAAHAGTLQQIGNWTPGQVMAHLAAWIEYGYDGISGQDALVSFA